MASYTISKEETNYARLAVALLQNCSDLLRETLHQHVPPPYTDIYAAIAASKSQLSQLNATQKELLFPKPPATFAVTTADFDISLLYCLIRNVSTLKAHGRGWGKSPANNPRDTSVIANVERIRILRNTIMAHSVNARISDSDFNDIWSEIEKCVDDLGTSLKKLTAVQSLANLKCQDMDPAQAIRVIKEFQALVEENKKGIEDIRKATDDNKQAMEDNRKTIDENSRQVAELERRRIAGLSNSNEKVADLQMTLCEQGTRLGTQRAKLDEVQKEQHVQGAQLDEHRSKLDKVEMTQQEQGAKLEEVQAMLTDSPIKQDHELKCKELKEKLIEIYRKNCMEIRISPLDTKGETFPIQKLYTDLVMVDKKDKKDSKSEDAKEKELTPVKSYNQIFYKEGKRMKTVFLLGEAGTGKSTFAKKMAADWVCAHTEDEKKLTPDVKTMKSFNYLFYVPLRAVPDCTSVIHAVLKSMEQYSRFKDTINRLFETQSESILVICDGLDEVKLDEKEEWKRKSRLNDCTTVTTTRPWKFYLVDQDLHHVDTELELRGLTEDGIWYLAGKILEVVRTDTSDETKCTLLHDLGLDDSYENPCTYKECELKTLSKIPQLLVFLIRVWYKYGRSFPTSQTEIFTKTLVLTLQCGQGRLLELDSCKEIWKRGSLSEDLFGKDKIDLLPYAGLLKRLSVLALDFLTCHDQESSLVFSSKDLEKYFEKWSDSQGTVINASKHVAACVRLGLLVKTDIQEPLYGPEYTYSFPHKSIQEFLAAVGIAQSPETGKSKFVKYCTSVRVLLEMSNVFRFVCGLSPETGSAVSAELVKMYDTDIDLLQCRRSLSSCWSPCKSLTSLYSDCINESRDKSIALHLTDCEVPGNKGEHIVTLIKYNNVNLKSLCIEPKSLEVLTRDNVHGSRVLSDMKNLEKLDIRMQSGSDGSSFALETAVNLSVLKHLRQLRLCIKISATLLQHLQHLFSLGRLEGLYLDAKHPLYQDTGHYMDFTPPVQLSQLTLARIAVTWSGWCGLLSSLGSCHSLETLEIRLITLPDREDTFTSGAKIDFSGCTQLKDIYIDGVKFGDMHLDFSPLVQLSKLTLGDVYMTWSGWCGLLSSLGSCHSLKTLKIMDIKLPDREDTFTSGTKIDFSGCTQITDISLPDRETCIHSPEVDLSHCTKLGRVCHIAKSFMFHEDGTEVSIADQHSTRYLSPLLSSLPQVKCLTHLELIGLDSDCVDILLNVLPHLCNLTTLELMYIDFGIRHLSLAHNTKLQKLVLWRVLFSSGVLDLAHSKQLEGIRFMDGLCHVSPTMTAGFSKHEPGTGQLVQTSNMELQELQLSKCQLSAETWHHVFSCVQNMQHLQKLTLLEPNITMELVRVPAHMHVRYKALNTDSTIRLVHYSCKTQGAEQ